MSLFSERLFRSTTKTYLNVFTSEKRTNFTVFLMNFQIFVFSFFSRLITFQFSLFKNQANVTKATGSSYKDLSLKYRSFKIHKLLLLFLYKCKNNSPLKKGVEIVYNVLFSLYFIFSSLVLFVFLHLILYALKYK